MLLWGDLRYSVRTLAAHPGLVVAGVVVLALGIGVNTAIFSVINAILFRPLPVHAPDELRYVYLVDPQQPALASGLRYRHFLELRDRRDVFADVTLVSMLRDRLRVEGDADVARGEMVSSNYFDTLGVKPLLGRAFVWSEDEPPNAPPVVIISYDLWQSRFAGRQDVLGQPIGLSADRISGYYMPWRAYTVVGVMPRGFKGLSNPWEATQYWVPFLQRAANLASDRAAIVGPRDAQSPLDFPGLPVARLKAGVTHEQAAAVVAVFGEGVFRGLRTRAPGLGLRLLESRRIRLPFDTRGQIVPSRLATALMAVSGMLLLIAAANLAGVLMARGVTRRGELAVRLTLGAGRWRLTRQLVTESLLLSTAGGALGLLVARWLVDLLIVGTPSRFVRWQIAVMSLDVPLDWRVLLVAAVSCLATGVLLGLVPARQAMRMDLLSGLAGESAGATRVVRGALRHWIVIPQVCLSLVLLMIAGTMTRALIRSEMVDPGYDADSVVLLDAQMPQQPYAPWTPDRGRQLRAERNAFGRRLLDQAGTAPGITAVTLSMTTPLMTVPLPSTNAWVAPREGFKPDGRHYWTAVMPVSDGYFATLDIRLLRGRTFDERDRADGARSAIVSEDLARWMWPDRDPVGQYLGRHFPDSPHPPHWMEVVGVVRNVHAPLSDGTWSPTVYEPLEQSELQLGVTLAARGESTPAELLQSLRQAVAEVDAQAVTSNPRTMREGIGEMLYPRRLAAAVLGASGAIGLLLASMGLYGVVSYSVAQRVREIGVRMALGADRDDIVRLIVREGARVAAAGIALGLMLAYAAIRLASRVVVELPSLDVATLLAVPALLSAVVVLACYLPALRAARVDPMVVLRTL